MYEKEVEGRIADDDKATVTKFRQLFRAAVEAWNDWRNEAEEDYNFVVGKQWTDEQIREFAKEKRPAIVINRIKPLINILSGWQRLNRYDLNFLPRTAEDFELCEVRKGMTKYVMDRCNYETRESTSFIDCAIGGIGWFGVKYKFDAETQDGEAVIERVDPFGIYCDPEAHELDFSDAKFICRAKWTDKAELQNVYPDKAEDVENNYSLYDPIEKENYREIEVNPLWYNAELKKIRVVECWYKEQVTKTLIHLNDGQTIQYSEENQEQIMQLMMTGAVADYEDVQVTAVRVCTFFDRTLLEDIESPYKHGEFPYVPMIYHYYGVGDTPAGFVRSLKDPQREINKRRIQEMHILDTSSNGGGFYTPRAMSPEQEEDFKENFSTPGYWNKVNDLNELRERDVKAPPAAIINAEQQATADLMAISGINENLLGTDIANGASGRAIELRQKQAVTHLSTIFDALRTAKKKIAYLLWGKRNKPGIIPQFYTADKIYRIEGDNGFSFLRVNQQVQDPMTGAIVRTINDLSVGEFDIVVDDVEKTATKRIADFYALTDAGSKLGLPPQIMVQPVLEYLDVPKRNEIIQQYQQIMQEQAQAQQAERDLKLRIEEIKNQDSRQVITFKDSPPEIQYAMAAKAGIIPADLANYVMQLAIQAKFPDFARQQQMQAIQQQQLQQAQLQQQMQNATANAGTNTACTNSNTAGATKY